MNFNPALHHRKSIRLKNYDYSKQGLYFITLCIENKQQIFGEIIGGNMILNELGKIAHNEWLNTANVRDNISLHEFIIMPDHFHAILEINYQKGENKQSIGAFKSPSQTIGSIIRGYKIATTKKIKDFLIEESPKIILGKNNSTGELQFAPNSKIWQRNYYESIIRDEKAYQNITNYIKNNPINWHKKKNSK
ncbi:MAG: hypothetical protein HYR91_08520 [Flavobacteriia bacterium]|nr:hypothetical protein [Flavobacteriia bacterium]